MAAAVGASPSLVLLPAVAGTTAFSISARCQRTLPASPGVHAGLLKFHTSPGMALGSLMSWLTLCSAANIWMPACNGRACFASHGHTQVGSALLNSDNDSNLWRAGYKFQ
eukprot:365052-Chlamydomonas_euryale.AAC.42